MVRLAFYKGPAPTTLRQIAHRIICWRTDGSYSHVELVVDGIYGWTASFLDGGVRKKAIAFDSGHWDVIQAEGDEAKAVAWFEAHVGEPYDWFSLLGWFVPWRVSWGTHTFCSEAVSSSLGLNEPWTISPNDLHRIVTKAA